MLLESASQDQRIGTFSCLQPSNAFIIQIGVGQSDKMPLIRDYFDFFPLTAYEHTLAKNEEMLWEIQSLVLRVVSKPRVFLCPKHGVDPTPMRTLAKCVLARSAWKVPLQRLQLKLGAAESTM